ncbi:hypothetical protein DIURU_000764 [Diutina rugosa]|uniref:Uncharacterized protein n=1 Tax=Diutina rugosa TaxID=5481 RepID=A0A642UWH6_DIURU|nr:uncharacterized protein DIURU_000764 [Diutina rugosa]KAA8907080.1 hypothetical protein DIURU_000764 [Diutina rugosa]
MDFRQVLASARKRDHSIHRYFDGDPSPWPWEPPPPPQSSSKSTNAVANYVNSSGTRQPSLRKPHKNHMPSVADLVCHLRLLRAFDVCKKTVLGADDSDELTRDKRWQIYVSNAVRRFTVFVRAVHKFSAKDHVRWFLEDDEESRFREGIRKDRNFMNRMVAILPPLDVVMVWHAFLLMPRTMYDHFMRSQFTQFAMFPLPLRLISNAIDNDTFIYDPAIHFKQTYHTVVSSYTDNYRDLIYHIDKLDQCQQLVDVFCPVCHEILVENVSWTSNDNTGFCDSGFVHAISLSYCKCFPTEKIVNHDLLRRRQLYADIHRTTALAGSYKYFSSIISPREFRHRDVNAINDNLKETLRRKLAKLKRMSLTEFVESLNSSRQGHKLNLLLRNYLLMNPIHCTIPGEGFEVWEDLVGAVLRQERFTQAMNDIDWLHQDQISHGLKESIKRYARFFSLITHYDQQQILVPTLDIDLVWHTHQLSMAFYFEDCMHAGSGCVVDHDDKVESARLDGGFTATAKLYRSHFNESYSSCFCKYCVGWRQQRRRRWSQVIIGGREENIVGPPDNTHISIHNAVELPSLSASMQRQQVRRRYQDSVTLPWEDHELLYYGNNPKQYVVPPTAPFSGENIHVFGNGLCCTVRDYGPA